MNKEMTKQMISLRLICINPPATQFGLQDKNGDIVIGTSLGDSRFAYAFELTVKQTDDGKPNFTGDFAHGTSKERFLYLTTKAQNNDNTWRIVQRIKVHLKSITWQQVETVLADPNAYLEAQVEGHKTGSVPLLGDGWIVQLSLADTKPKN